MKAMEGLEFRVFAGGWAMWPAGQPLLLEGGKGTAGVAGTTETTETTGTQGTTGTGGPGSRWREGMEELERMGVGRPRQDGEGEEPWWPVATEGGAE